MFWTLSVYQSAMWWICLLKLGLLKIVGLCYLITLASLLYPWERHLLDFVRNMFISAHWCPAEVVSVLQSRQFNCTVILPNNFDQSDEDPDSFCGEDDEVFVLVSRWGELIAGVSCTDLELPALASQFLICSSTSSHSEAQHNFMLIQYLINWELCFHLLFGIYNNLHDICMYNTLNVLLS